MWIKKKYLQMNHMSVIKSMQKINPNENNSGKLKLENEYKRKYVLITLYQKLTKRMKLL